MSGITMPENFHLRDTTGEACGPGSRKDLVSNFLPGPNETITLNTTGDTWNKVMTTSVGGLIFPAGTWSADLFLKVLFGVSARVNIDLSRYDATCVLQEILLQDSMIVTSPFFVSHSFSGSVGRVFFRPNDLLVCVVWARTVPADIQYNQDPSPASVLTIPTRITHRPLEYYKRQRRRRSA